MELRRTAEYSNGTATYSNGTAPQGKDPGSNGAEKQGMAMEMLGVEALRKSEILNYNQKGINNGKAES